MTQQRSIFDPNPQEAENDAQRRAAFQNTLATGRSYFDLVAPADAPPAQPSPFTSVVAGKEIEDPLPAEGAGPFAYKYWIKRAKDANDELRRRLAIERERGDGRTAWAGASREALALAPITGDPERDARIREFLERRDSVLAEGVKAGVGWAAGAASFLTGKEGHRAAAIVKGLANPADKGIETNPLEASAKELFTEVLPYSLGQSAPAMAAGAAAAIGGAAGGGAVGLGLLGKTALGAGAAAVATHPFSRQEAIGSFAEQEGRAPQSTREKVSLETGAALGSALDAGSSAVPALRVVGKIPFQRIQQLLRKGSRDVAVREAKKAVGVQGRKVLLDFVKNVGTEGLTEAIGEAARTSGVAVAREEGISGEDVQGVVAEGIIGGLLGVPLAAGAAARGPFQQQEGAPPTPDPAAPEPDPVSPDAPPAPIDVEGEVVDAAPELPALPAETSSAKQQAEQLRRAWEDGGEQDTTPPGVSESMADRIARWEATIEVGTMEQRQELVESIRGMHLDRASPVVRMRLGQILARAMESIHGPGGPPSGPPSASDGSPGAAPQPLPPPPETEAAAAPQPLPPPDEEAAAEPAGPREPDLTTASEEGGSANLAEQNLETWRSAMTSGDTQEMQTALQEIETLRMEDLSDTVRSQTEGIRKSLQEQVERQELRTRLEESIPAWLELAKSGDRDAMSAAMVEIRNTNLKTLQGGSPLEAKDLARRVRQAEVALGKAITEKIAEDAPAARKLFQDRYDHWKRAAASVELSEVQDTLSAMEGIHPGSLTGTQRPKYIALRDKLKSLRSKMEERAKRMPDDDPESLDIPEGKDSEMLAGTFNDEKPVTVRYAVVEADTLRASDAQEGYDRGLQPRSEMGKIVNEIAQNPRWLEVSESGTAQQGAPVASPSLTGGKRDVEVGNHRAAGLQRAYQAGRAGDYRENLEAAYPEAQGMRQPILVRVRTERLDAQQRRDFVNAANQSLTQEVQTSDRSRDLAPIAREWLKNLASGGLFARDGELPGAYGQRGSTMTDKQQEGTDTVPLGQELASKFSPAERSSLWVPGDGRPVPTEKLTRQVLNALVHAAYGNEVLTANLSEARPGNKTIQTAYQDAAPGVIWLDELAEKDYVPTNYSIGELLGRVAGEMFGQSGGAKAAVFTQKLLSSGESKALLRAVADILLAPKWKREGEGWRRMTVDEELRRRLRGPVQMADSIKAVVKALGEHADLQRAREKAGVSSLLGGPRKPTPKAPPVIEVIQKVLRERDDADKSAPKSDSDEKSDDEDSDAATSWSPKVGDPYDPDDKRIIMVRSQQVEGLKGPEIAEVVRPAELKDGQVVESAPVVVSLPKPKVEKAEAAGMAPGATERERAQFVLGEIPVRMPPHVDPLGKGVGKKEVWDLEVRGRPVGDLRRTGTNGRFRWHAPDGSLVSEQEWVDGYREGAPAVEKMLRRAVHDRAVATLRGILGDAVVVSGPNRHRVTPDGILEVETETGTVVVGKIGVHGIFHHWQNAPGEAGGLTYPVMLVQGRSSEFLDPLLDEIRDGPPGDAPLHPGVAMSMEPETEERAFKLDFDEPQKQFVARLLKFKQAVGRELDAAKEAKEEAAAIEKQFVVDFKLDEEAVAEWKDAEWDARQARARWMQLRDLFHRATTAYDDASAGMLKQSIQEDLLRLHIAAGISDRLPAVIAAGEYLGGQGQWEEGRHKWLITQEAEAIGYPLGARRQLRTFYREPFSPGERKALQEWLQGRMRSYSRYIGYSPVRLASLRRSQRSYTWGSMRTLDVLSIREDASPMTMSGTLDHEAIHFLRSMGIIRDEEWEQALDWLTNEDIDAVIRNNGYKQVPFSAILEEALAFAHTRYRAEPELRNARPNKLFDLLERGETHDRKPDWRMRMGILILHFFDWLRRQLRSAPALIQRLVKRVHLWIDEKIRVSRTYRPPKSARRRWREHQESGGAPRDFAGAGRTPKSVRRQAAREHAIVRSVTSPDNRTREGEPITGKVRLLLRLGPNLLRFPVVRQDGKTIEPRRDIAIEATSLPKPNSKMWVAVSGKVAATLPGVARTEVEWRDGKWRRAGTNLEAPKFTHVRAAWDARQRRWRLWVHRAPANVQEAVVEAVANPDVTVDELAADPTVQEAIKKRAGEAAQAVRGDSKDEKPDLEVTNHAASQREEEERWRIWAGQWVLPPLAMDWSLPEAKESIHLMRRGMNEAQSARSRLRRSVTRDYLSPYQKLSEKDQLALNKFLFQQDLYNEWPDAAARRRALQKLGVENLKAVERLATAARRILFEDVGDVLREQQAYMRGMWRRRVRQVMEEITGNKKDLDALTAFWQLRERLQREQAAHRRREIQREADARRSGAQFEPREFEPKLTETQKKLWGRVRHILSRWAGNDPLRLEKVADFWNGTARTAIVDVTEFRRAYMPHRWYGQFQLVRFDADNNPTVLGGGPGKASGFNNENEANAAMEEDWEGLSDEEREGVRYVLVPRRGPKADRVTPLDARPGQAFALDRELYRAVGRGGKSALDQLIKDAGMFEIKLPAEALKRARRAATRGVQRRRLFREEIRNAMLSSTQRRTGSEGWSWDSGQVIMDHAMDVAYHIHRDRVMFHGISVLHGSGVTHGLHGGSDPRDTHETQAYRALVRDALGIPGLLQQQLDRLDRSYPFLRWTSERREAVDLILKSMLYRMLIPGLPATLWLEAGLWPLAIAAAHGTVMGAVATQLGRGSRSERVAAGDALLQGWVKLGPIATHLAFALQNITLPLLTGVMIAGYRNQAAGIWEKHTDWLLNPKRKREIREALRRQNIEGQALAHLELLASDKAMSRRVLRFLRIMNVFGILTESYTRELAYRAGRRVATRAGLKVDAEIEAAAEKLSPVERETLLLSRYDPSESADAFAERTGFAMSVDYGPTGRPRLHRIHAPPVHGRFKFRTFHSNILYLLYLAPMGGTPMMGRQFQGGKRTLRNRAATTMSAGAQMVLLAGIYQGYVGMMVAAYYLLMNLLSGGDEEEGEGWGTPIADTRIEMERKSLERRESGRIGDSVLDQGVFSLMNTSMSNSLGVLPVTSAFSVKDIDLREILAGASIQSELAVAESMASSRTLGEGLRQSIGRVSPGIGRAYEGYRLPPPLVPRENDDVRSSTGRPLYDHGTLTQRLQMAFGLTPTYQARLQDKQNFDRLLKAHKEQFSREFQRLLERALLTDDRELLARIVRARSLYGVGKGNILQEFQQPVAAQVVQTAKRLKVQRTARQRLWRGLPEADLGIPIWKRLLDEETGRQPSR